MGEGVDSPAEPAWPSKAWWSGITFTLLQPSLKLCLETASFSHHHKPVNQPFAGQAVVHSWEKAAQDAFLSKFSCKSYNCGISSYCKGALTDVNNTCLSPLKKQTSNKGMCKVSGGVLKHWGTREGTLLLLLSALSYILICNSGAHNVF